MSGLLAAGKLVDRRVQAERMGAYAALSSPAVVDQSSLVFGQMRPQFGQAQAEQLIVATLALGS